MAKENFLNRSKVLRNDIEENEERLKQTYPEYEKGNVSFEAHWDENEDAYVSDSEFGTEIVNQNNKIRKYQGYQQGKSDGAIITTAVITLVSGTVLGVSFLYDKFKDKIAAKIQQFKEKRALKKAEKNAKLN